MTTTDPATHAVQALEAGMVVGNDGSEIGRVGQVYTDNDTGQPSWVTVKTGWFGSNESFVPLSSATVAGDTIRVPFDKDTIKGAPNNEAGAPLSEADEQRLYSYYGLTSTSDRVSDTTPADTMSNVDQIPAQAGSVGSGEYLTRSEEQLRVGTEKVPTGRARLRKIVVTEQQNVTVPVSREEVRVVREPIAPGDSVDATIGEAATDVTLTEERLVVDKQTVPVERVRLGTETVTEQQQVTESVRKEQIELDDATSVDTDRRSEQK